MNTGQILTIDTSTPEGREELSRVAGEILSTGPHEHGRPEMYSIHCPKCYKQLWTYEEYARDSTLTDEANKPCTVADPIPLTWPEAMKWRDWAYEMFGCVAFERAIKRMQVIDNRSYFGWIALATPSDYIKAAIICKLNAKGKK